MSGKNDQDRASNSDAINHFQWLRVKLEASPDHASEAPYEAVLWWATQTWVHIGFHLNTFPTLIFYKFETKFMKIWKLGFKILYNYHSLLSE